MGQQETELVQIGQRASTAEESANTTEKSGMSRRRFLQILGAGSAAGVAGCARDQAENVFPFVKGEPDQIPGVAVWYRSSCRECSAGCGIQVRTREGRAVKIEGNPEHPINRGGLCGLGQAALQGLYDPDRVRQPLVRDTASSNSEPKFNPISWDEAYARVGAALKSGSGKRLYITGEESGALEELIRDSAKAFNGEHVTFDPLQPVALAKASELVYGSYGIPTFQFERADVVLNFGSGFLETWVSPCEYARGWAKSRRGEKPAKVVHVEPRLSLTGANADVWLNAKPGSEIKIALLMLKDALQAGRGTGLRDDVRESLSEIVKGTTLDGVSAETGIPANKLAVASQYLLDSHSSLVVAGGTAAASADPLPLQVIVAFLNLVLGNVGKTVNIASMRKPRSSVSKLAAAIESMRKGEVGLVFMHGTNPRYSLPLAFGFEHAVQKVRVGPANGKPGLVVSFSSHLDETAQLADIILPSHHSLESWGDARPLPGVYNLLQPVMTSVFDTHSFGDSLLKLASLGGQSSVAGGADDFEAYVKNSWKKLHSSLNVAGDFGRFWLESLERGGYVDNSQSEDRAKVSVQSEALKLKFSVEKAHGAQKADGELVFYPYPSVKSFDGRAANKPWLQELPDPITSIVWDAWAELHPHTATSLGVANGDYVQLRTNEGEMQLPVLITEYVHRDVVAVPMGQGHTSYGRIAKLVGGGNAFALLAANTAGDSVALMGSTVKAIRGRGRLELIKTQGSDSQFGRGIMRTSFIGGAAEAAAEGEGEHEEEHPKQMYKQREHPLYQWGLNVDLNACTGCGACVVACYAENNIAVVGRAGCSYGREMSWLRIDRYFEGSAEELTVGFQPMMCQQCHNAPCEPVCPVFATYHNEEGLNAMVYNRCVGTRYCSNNCTYKVRRFNFFEYDVPEPLSWQLNPDVTKRSMGVMEKCTFCVQRIVEAKDRAKDEGRMVRDGEVQPACVQGCPTQALTFGNLNDKGSAVSKLAQHERAYKVLDHVINTQPAVTYMERVKYKI